MVFSTEGHPLPVFERPSAQRSSDLQDFRTPRFESLKPRRNDGRAGGMARRMLLATSYDI